MTLADSYSQAKIEDYSGVDMIFIEYNTYYKVIDESLGYTMLVTEILDVFCAFSGPLYCPYQLVGTIIYH